MCFRSLERTRCSVTVEGRKSPACTDFTFSESKLQTRRALSVEWGAADSWCLINVCKLPFLRTQCERGTLLGPFFPLQPP